MAWKIEVTDTFGGDANYSWVNRGSLTKKYGFKDRAIVRDAKAQMGWTGVKCRTERYGDEFRLYPRNMCQVMFITWEDNYDPDDSGDEEVVVFPMPEPGDATVESLRT